MRSFPLRDLLPLVPVVGRSSVGIYNFLPLFRCQLSSLHKTGANYWQPTFKINQSAFVLDVDNRFMVVRSALLIMGVAVEVVEHALAALGL